MKFILRKEIVPKDIACWKDKIKYVPTEDLKLMKNKKLFAHLLENKTFEQIPDIQVEEIRFALENDFQEKWIQWVEER